MSYTTVTPLFINDSIITQKMTQFFLFPTSLHLKQTVLQNLKSCGVERMVVLVGIGCVNLTE